jgi:hypothetical protein
MKARAKSIPRGLKIGSALVIISGLFPISLAARNFVLYIVSVANPDKPWKARNYFPDAYTLNDIRAFNERLALDFELATHVELSNLLTTGVMIVLIGIFGIRRGEKWAWYLMVFIGVWAGFNDLIAMIHAEVFPLAAIPDGLGLIGLLIASRATFNSDDQR